MAPSSACSASMLCGAGRDCGAAGSGSLGTVESTGAMSSDRSCRLLVILGAEALVSRFGSSLESSACFEANFRTEATRETFMVLVSLLNPKFAKVHAEHSRELRVRDTSTAANATHDATSSTISTACRDWRLFDDAASRRRLIARGTDLAPRFHGWDSGRADSCLIPRFTHASETVERFAKILDVRMRLKRRDF